MNSKTQMPFSTAASRKEMCSTVFKGFVTIYLLIPFVGSVAFGFTVMLFA